MFNNLGLDVTSFSLNDGLNAVFRCVSMHFKTGVLLTLQCFNLLFGRF